MSSTSSPVTSCKLCASNRRVELLRLSDGDEIYIADNNAYIADNSAGQVVVLQLAGSEA